MYTDAYAHLYQKMEGFKIKIYAPNNKFLKGWLSLKPSTRSTYDIAMRDATIDGLITMDKIQDLKVGQLFYREVKPEELFMLQSVNEFEFQKNTRNINAVKQNSYSTIQRLVYNVEKDEEVYENVYTNLASFITTVSRDEKNFAAGIEDNTNISIQIPKVDINGKLYYLQNGDRIILNNMNETRTKKVKIESIDEFSVPGIIKIYGTFDTRT